MNKLLNDILESCREFTKMGAAASYIPELAKADPSDLGICIVEIDGKIIELAHEYFDLPKEVNTYEADGRAYIKRSFDIVEL